MRLSGKVAIVSGAGSGMGAAIARLFAGEGSQRSGRRHLPGGRAGDGPADRGRRRAGAVHRDRCHPRVRLGAAGGGRHQLRPVGLDILVNNAGLSSSSFEDPFDRDGWDAIISVNATGVYLGTRAAIPAIAPPRRRRDRQSVVDPGPCRRRRRPPGLPGVEGRRQAPDQGDGDPLGSPTRSGPQGIRANSVHPAAGALGRPERPGHQGAGRQGDAPAPHRRTDRGRLGRALPGLRRGILR